VVASVVLLLAACAGGGAPATPHSYVPRGRLLLYASLNGGQPAVYQLPSGPANELAIPSSLGYLAQMAWGPRGDVYVLAYGAYRATRPRLYRFAAGASPQLVAQPLRRADGFSVRGDLLVAFSCPGPISVIDLDHPSGWRRAGAGCGAALSDGTQVASLDQGGLWTRATAGGPVQRLLTLSRIAALNRQHVEQHHLVPEMSWGPGGIAFTLGSQARQVVVLRTDAGRVHVISVGGFVYQLEWQPDGRLLAFGVTGAFGGAPGTAEVRLLDAATGHTREVVASHEYGQFQWSPDGRVLAVSKAVDTVVFVDPRGRQLGHVTVPGVVGGWSA
jgi:Tol biopolymer transport system component